MNLDRVKNSAKICFGGVISFLFTYSILGLSPAILSGLGSIYGYLVTFKGFHKKRVFMRTIKILIAINLAVLVSHFSQSNIFLLSIISFIFITAVTFFSFEEYLGGFMAHRPILYIYILSLQIKSLETSLVNMLGLTIGIVLSVIIGQLFWPSDPDKKMNVLIEDYLNNISKEIYTYQIEGEINLAKKATRKSYQNFLNEFHKTICGNDLSSNYGKKLFDFTLMLHNFIEMIRISFKNDKLNKKQLIQLNDYLKNLKENKFIQIKESKNSTEFNNFNSIINLLFKKKQALQKKNDDYVKYHHHHNFYIWFKRHLNIYSVRSQYALKMAITLTIGILLMDTYVSGKSIWLPTTLLVLVLPYGADSKKKSYNRIIGTFLGIILASFVIPYVKSDFWKGILAISSFFPAFLFMGKNYSGVVTFTTLGTVFMNISYASVDFIFTERIFYTLVASIIIVTIEYLFRDKNNKSLKIRMIEMVKNDLIIVKKMIYIHNYSLDDHIDDFVLKGYLYRELLLRQLNKIVEDKFDRLIKNSIIFMDRLMFLYSELKKGDFSKDHLNDLRFLENFLKKYILFLENGEESEILLIQEKIISNQNKEITLELLELTNYLIESSLYKKDPKK